MIRLKTATIVERAWNRVKRGIETVHIVSRISQVWIATNPIWLGSINQVQLSELQKVITWWSTDGPPYANDFSQSQKVLLWPAQILLHPVTVYCTISTNLSRYVTRYTHCSLDLMFTTKFYLLLTSKIVHRCWTMPPNIYLTAPPVWRPAQRPMQIAKFLERVMQQVRTTSEINLLSIWWFRAMRAFVRLCDWRFRGRK